MSQFPDIHFEMSERKILLRIFDLLFIFAFLEICSLSFEFYYFSIDSTTWYRVIVLAIYYSIFASIFEMYDLRKADRFQVTLKNIVLSASVTVLFYLLTPFFTPILPENRLQILYFFLAMAGGLALWRYAYTTLISSPRFNKRIVVVGDTFDINTVVKELYEVDPNYKIVGYVNTDINAPKSELDQQLRAIEVPQLIQTVKENGVSEIVVASSYSEGVSVPLYNELIALLESGYPIKEYTQVFEDITQRVPVHYVDKDFYRFFPFNRSNKNQFYLFFHRVFDIIFSLSAIVLTLAVIPLVLIGNIIANRGRLFYQQKRVGRNGKVFKIVKFRTMVKDAERDGAKWSFKGDVRITPFGKIMRNLRLDELPQCLNVLKGEMSFIGPRPERPVFVEELKKRIPFYETRHIVKPGLTGWAQVKGRYGSSEEDALEKLQYDLYYIKHRGLFLDLNILLKTISTVLYYRGQ